MSESYERERCVPVEVPRSFPILQALNSIYRQNNNRLGELSSKVSALRDVTINIYDNARDQATIDNASEGFSGLSNSLRGSTSRLTRMAQQGNKVAILKLAGMLAGSVLVLYWLARFIL